MLSRAGVKVEELSDGFRIHGPADISGSAYDSHGDHRIAMSSAILSLLAADRSKIRETACVATSFPGFTELMNILIPGSVSDT
jgi:3-phosphoshikimate 1-carboxyvinyltransferase